MLGASRPATTASSTRVEPTDEQGQVHAGYAVMMQVRTTSHNRLGRQAGVVSADVCRQLTQVLRLLTAVPDLTRRSRVAFQGGCVTLYRATGGVIARAQRLPTCVPNDAATSYRPFLAAIPRSYPALTRFLDGEQMTRHLVVSADIAGAVRADEALLREKVVIARADGRSWGQIGASLGVSRQAARERFTDRSRRTTTWPSGGLAKARASGPARHGISGRMR
jgi:hypothetical protein